MFCQSCGKPIEFTSAVFCPSCGVKIEQGNLDDAAGPSVPVASAELQPPDAAVDHSAGGVGWGVWVIGTVLFLGIAAGAWSIVAPALAPDASSQISSQIGASRCTKTGYEIINRFDQSKQVIYDCTVNGARMCVTTENGIPHNASMTVALVFANALGSNRPPCLESLP